MVEGVTVTCPDRLLLFCWLVTVPRDDCCENALFAELAIKDEITVEEGRKKVSSAALDGRDSGLDSPPTELELPLLLLLMLLEFEMGAVLPELVWLFWMNWFRVLLLLLVLLLNELAILRGGCWKFKLAIIVHQFP